MLNGRKAFRFQRCQYSVGGRPCPFIGGGKTSRLLHRGEVVPMGLTYSELFQFCLVLIGIVGLVIQAKNKK